MYDNSCTTFPLYHIAKANLLKSIAVLYAYDNELVRHLPLFVVPCLLERRVNSKSKIGHTPLHLACRFGHLPVVVVLLAGGAEINARDSDGNTPLHKVSRWGPFSLAFIYTSGLIFRLLFAYFRIGTSTSYHFYSFFSHKTFFWCISIGVPMVLLSPGAPRSTPEAGMGTPLSTRCLAEVFFTCFHVCTSGLLYISLPNNSELTYCCIMSYTKFIFRTRHFLMIWYSRGGPWIRNNLIMKGRLIFEGMHRKNRGHSGEPH